MDVFVSSLDIDVSSFNIWSGAAGSVPLPSDDGDGASCHAEGEGEGSNDEHEDEPRNPCVADTDSEEEIGNEVPASMLEAFVLLQGTDLSQELESDQESGSAEDAGPLVHADVPEESAPGADVVGHAAAPQDPLRFPRYMRAATSERVGAVAKVGGHLLAGMVRFLTETGTSKSDPAMIR
jgi:hypothetical protein